MGLKKIKEGCWVDSDNQYWSLNEWFAGKRNQMLYYITNGEGFCELYCDKLVPEEELYERIYLPGKNAVLAFKN